MSGCRYQRFRGVKKLGDFNMMEMSFESKKSILRVVYSNGAIESI